MLSRWLLIHVLGEEVPFFTNQSKPLHSKFKKSTCIQKALLGDHRLWMILCQTVVFSSDYFILGIQTSVIEFLMVYFPCLGFLLHSWFSIYGSLAPFSQLQIMAGGVGRGSLLQVAFYFPRDMCTEVLIPSTCECHLIWKQGFFKKQGKPEFLQQILFQHNKCLDKPDKSGHRNRHTLRRTPHEDEDRVQGIATTSQRTPKIPSKVGWFDRWVGLISNCHLETGFKTVSA